MFEEVTIGECRLILGDCREVLPLLPPVDLVLTDPPYGISRAGQKETFTKERKHKRKHYDDLGWDDDTPPHWFFGLLIEKSAEQMIWGGNYFTYALPPSMGWLYWDKGQDGLSMSDGELCFTSRQSALRAFRLNRGEIAKDGAEHPTQKPLRLMTWCLSLVPDARTVCDPFMGSGTTGVACARMGLQFVGIERERKYFDIACRRIEQAYAQPRLFEDAKVGAGDTAVQGDMLLPANAALTGRPRTKD